ncbi:hypothetical protein EDB83DRAFT_1980016 [Lactarius deliciosus]|nr:hypothetical protein EDB83DRAFT_1980016 [Lactarius deliciosus]
MSHAVYLQVTTVGVALAWPFTHSQYNMKNTAQVAFLQLLATIYTRTHHRSLSHSSHRIAMGCRHWYSPRKRLLEHLQTSRVSPCLVLCLSIATPSTSHSPWSHPLFPISLKLLRRFAPVGRDVLCL